MSARRRSSRDEHAAAYAPFVAHARAALAFLGAHGFGAPRVTVRPLACTLEVTAPGWCVSVAVEYAEPPLVTLARLPARGQVSVPWLAAELEPAYAAGVPPRTAGPEAALTYAAAFLERHAEVVFGPDPRAFEAALARQLAAWSAHQARELMPSPAAFADPADPAVRFVALVEARFEFLRTDHGFARRALWVGAGRATVSFYADATATTVTVGRDGEGPPTLDLFRYEPRRRLVLSPPGDAATAPVPMAAVEAHLDRLAAVLAEHGRAFLAGDADGLAAPAPDSPPVPGFACDTGPSAVSAAPNRSST